MTDIPHWAHHHATPQHQPSPHIQTPQPAEPDQDNPNDTPPPLFFGSVDEFVRDFVRLVFRRDVGETGRSEHRWSARWWESAEAVIRLEAMWRAWEQARNDPSTGISTWLRDHADHHMAILMNPTGPFAHSQDTASSNDPLPYEAPPLGLFPDVRNSMLKPTEREPPHRM